MRQNVTAKVFVLIFICLLTVSGYFFWADYTSQPSNIAQNDTKTLLKKVEQSLDDDEEDSAEEKKKGRFNKPRYKYLFKLLRDPATNAIPDNIRSRELSYARTLPTFRQVKSKMKGKAEQVEGFNWSNAGPNDVGGRTRALGIDRRSPDTLIAGGVSGGIWKSTDGGDSWEMKTPDVENLSVTSLAQHPINQDTWYYTSGEFIGNSASANNSAPYYGTGIFRSTDNGETWSRISSTSDRNTSFNSRFDFMSRIKIHPSGTIYVASNGFGILRSTDGNDFSEIALGGAGFHAYADVAIASNGDILAVLSSQDASGSSVSSNPGIFISEDNGQNWNEVTPSTFPQNHGRSVITFAPSDPNIAYVLTDKLNDETTQGVSFHELNLGTGQAFNYSPNLPDFRSSPDSENESGWMNLQGGYNMVVAVKPDNPNYVFVGGTNLFRSTDGFATSPADGYDASNASQVDQYWIGGYSQENNFNSYDANDDGVEQHPDQHVIVFDPANPDRMWTGHDGGLSVTENVTANEVSWIDRNSGYLVTQFYTSAIPAAAGDNRLMGGTQDNGTPFFRAEPGGSPNISLTSTDISFGDGGYAFFTQDHFFVSSQLGRIIRYNKSPDGNIASPFSYVFPAAAEGQLFINPYTVDPNDQDNLYYSAGSQLWRTTEATSIATQNSDGATTGFSNLTSAAMPGGYTISTLEVTQEPANILYYAGSSDSGSPIIYKLENADANTEPQDVSIDGAPGGAWVKDIAVNPVNGNEAIAVMSNYNIIGLYHTTNGGENWTAIEGDLAGDGSSAFLGPSLRSAAIIPSDEGIIYSVGTSTGIYTTALLEGPDTVWGQVATETVGYAVTDYLASRVSDGDIAAGTHGRGMFLGDFQGNTDAPFVIADPAQARAGEVITLTANDFQFSPASSEVEFGGVPAEVISISADSTQMQVEVPRGVTAPQAENNTITISVMADGQSVSTAFTILPPNNFSISQNFPNPFNLSTTVPFDLPTESRVTLNIYNIAGKRVRQPLRGAEFNAGTYNRSVDFSGLASGIYIYRVVAEPQSGDGQTFIESKKMTFIK